MNFYEVERHLPIPPKNTIGKARLLLNTMNIGDSFVVPSAAERDCVMRVNARDPKIRVTSRKLSNGYRIWRIA